MISLAMMRPSQYLPLLISWAYILTKAASRDQYGEENMIAYIDDVEGNNMLISDILAEQWCGLK